MYRQPQPHNTNQERFHQQSFLRLAQPILMADLTREQLRQVLIDLGETPGAQLDESGASSPHLRKDRGRHVQELQDAGQGPLSMSTAGEGPEPRLQQEEGGPGGFLLGHARSDGSGQSHHGPAADGCDEEDHGDNTVASHRCGGVREAQRMLLPRHPEPLPRLRHVDQADLCGEEGLVRSTASALGIVARGPGEGRAEVPGDASEQIQGLSEKEGSTIDSLSQFQHSVGPRECRTLRDAGSHQRPSPGGRSAQARTGSQEAGESRRERDRDGRLIHPCPSEEVETDEDDDDRLTESISTGDGAARSANENLSASERLSRQLTLGRARRLEADAWSIVPQVYQSLVNEGRTVLMEVCCSPNSLLTTTVQHLTGQDGSASRCSHWNCGDLGSGKGLKLALQRLEVENPSHVWLSPPCGPFFPPTEC